MVGVCGEGFGQDLDFLYYQFMPLHGLPIYSNLGEKRAVIVSGSLSILLPLPVPRVIYRLGSLPLTGDLRFVSTFYTSLPPRSRFSSRSGGWAAYLCRWKIGVGTEVGGTRRRPAIGAGREKGGERRAGARGCLNERQNERGVRYEVFEYQRGASR